MPIASGQQRFAILLQPAQPRTAKQIQRKMLVLLEHLNFKIPYESGEKVINDFFVNRLGCPECPTGRLRVSPPVKGSIPEGEAKQMHVNMGLSQIHFEWCTGDGRPYNAPQRLEGCVTLAIKDMDLLKRKLAGIPYHIDEKGNVVVTDPFGLTTWVCAAAPPEVRDFVGGMGDIRKGGVGNVIALLRVDYDCRPGVSKTIADFYRKAFHAPVLQHASGFAVQTNLGQVISFNETERAPPENGYDINPQLWGIHMCFYIEKYEENSRRLHDLFWVNPDYKIPPINDNVSTVEGALKSKQFRLKEVGDKFVLEHEIRAMDHPLSPLKSLKAAL